MPKKLPNGLLGQIKRNIFFILVLGVTLAFVGLIQDFLIAIFWAAVISIISYSAYRWVYRKTSGKRNLAATITTLLILLFVIIPLAILTIALVSQATDLVNGIENQEINPGLVLDYVETNYPGLVAFLENNNLGLDRIRGEISQAAVGIVQTIGSRALSYTGSILNFFVQFSLMLYLLFFFFRDGKEIMDSVVNSIPMGNIREKRLFQRFAEVSRATLKGTVIVAITQGAIGGILFAALGIPAALFWGVVMTFLALLPVGGSAIVWGPAAIALFVQGEVAKAIITLVVGSLIIGLVDNFLRPLLVGKDTGMPDYLVLVSTLGGITYFGLTGFVIGPVIAALFITVWEMMGAEYGGKTN